MASQNWCWPCSECFFLKLVLSSVSFSPWMYFVGLAVQPILPCHKIVATVIQKMKQVWQWATLVTHCTSIPSQSCDRESLYNEKQALLAVFALVMAKCIMYHHNHYHHHHYHLVPAPPTHMDLSGCSQLQLTSCNELKGRFDSVALWEVLRNNRNCLFLLVCGFRLGFRSLGVFSFHPNQIIFLQSSEFLETQHSLILKHAYF